MTLSISYGALKSAPGAPSKKTPRTPAQQSVFRLICRLWARHQGWPSGRWPRNRIYDAVLISQVAVKFAAPVAFWKRAIEAAPVGASFAWLTTGPSGRTVSRLEEWHVHWRLIEWKRMKQTELEDDGRSLAAVMARVMARHPVGESA